jgi:hypothetical protein
MTRLNLHRFWHQRLVALALGALLGLQGIGLWHGIAHALPGAQQAAPAHASGDAWGHRAGDLACELLDHLAQASPLATPATVLALAPLPAAAPTAPAPAGRAADTPSAFLARAPPQA